MAAVSVDEVLITPELARRPGRPPDYEAEARALVELATTMSETPRSVLQKLANCALALCRAGSAGVSVWEPGEEDVFRWRATAGAYAQYLGGTLPRGFSPCGTVLDRDASLLMAEPVRFFPYISELCAPVCEVLLVPFYQEGKAVGTVWVVAHDAERHFDAEDERLVTSLTKFAATAVLTLNRIEAAERAEAALREEGRKKDDFIAILAHELRNPLAPISTGITLLRTEQRPEENTRTLAVMQRQVQHMVRLIDDLLDVSRITQGKLELRREPVAIEGILDAAVEGSQLHIARGKHSLHRPAVDPGLILDADPTRLAQVVGNLLNNAAKYTPDHGQIELCARRDGDFAVISVRDTGLGIPPERLQDVFELFSQVNRALDRSQGGLGIGLALVRRLVEMHGGSVGVSSAGPHLGSTFSVRLPLASGGAPVATTLEAQHEPTPQQGARILVVDDNDDAAELLTLALSHAGYEVLVARDGPAALLVADAAVPRFVILDIGLPGMSGYEVAAHFRRDERFEGSVLIALTGWGTEQDRQRAMQAGFDLHLTKPVAADALRVALRGASTLRADRVSVRA